MTVGELFSPFSNVKPQLEVRSFRKRSQSFPNCLLILMTRWCDPIYCFLEDKELVFLANTPHDYNKPNMELNLNLL